MTYCTLALKRMHYKHYNWHWCVDRAFKLWNNYYSTYKAAKGLRQCSHGESFFEQARFVSFIQEERTVDMGWSRAPDIQGLALQETSAKRFGVCFEDWKEPFVTGSEGAGRFIGGEKSEDRWGGVLCSTLTPPGSLGCKQNCWGVHIIVTTQTQFVPNIPLIWSDSHHTLGPNLSTRLI